jgi:hypothetical protein
MSTAMQTTNRRRIRITLKRGAVVLGIAAAVVGPQAQGPLFTPAPGSPITVGPGSGEVVLADLNRDGHLDLLTKHLLGQSISVRLGDGKGHFQPLSEDPMRLGYQPGAIALGDINNDSSLDLGIASREQDNEYVHIFIGTGRGSFSEVSGSPFATRASFEFYKPTLYFVDINEDRKVDIVTANGRRNTVEILFGNGQGRFSMRPSVPFESGRDRYSFAVGDVDGDGHLDLVAASSVETDGGLGRIHIKRGDGTGAFADAPGFVLSVPPNPRLGALSDVNGDKHSDIVVTHGRSRLVEILVNRGHGMFTPAPNGSYSVAGEANGIVVADVNRDGTNDLVAATVNSVTVLLGNANGFVLAPGSPFPAGPGAYNVTAGDLNGDGKIDLVASSFEGDAITVLLGR